MIMLIATSLSTFIATAFVTLLNLHGDLYDISATGGSIFLALAWVAVILWLLRNLPFLSTLRICTADDRRLEDTSEAIRLLESS